MSGEKVFLCSICFQPIELTKCKIDGNGRAVHEKCYAQMLLHTSIEKLPPKKRPRFLETKRRVG
jgi:hypothetical protein